MFTSLESHCHRSSDRDIPEGTRQEVEVEGKRYLGWPENLGRKIWALLLASHRRPCNPVPGSVPEVGG